MQFLSPQKIKFSKNKNHRLIHFSTKDSIFTPKTKIPKQKFCPQQQIIAFSTQDPIFIPKTNISQAKNSPKTTKNKTKQKNRDLLNIEEELSENMLAIRSRITSLQENIAGTHN